MSNLYSHGDYIKSSINNFKSFIKPNNIKHSYGQKEVPNVLLTCHCFPPETTEADKKTIYLDTLSQYYEEYDNRNGFKVIIETPLFRPEDYKILTGSKYFKYTIMTDEIWRSAEDGKDYFFSGMERSFNRLKIQHKSACEGENYLWYLTFYNENPKPTPQRKETKLEKLEF